VATYFFKKTAEPSRLQNPSSYLVSWLALLNDFRTFDWARSTNILPWF